MTISRKLSLITQIADPSESGVLSTGHNCTSLPRFGPGTICESFISYLP